MPCRIGIHTHIYIYIYIYMPSSIVRIVQLPQLETDELEPYISGVCLL